MEVEYEFVETQFTNQEREARGNIIKLLGATQNVAGDGSCFIYAVLLGMKQLDHQAGMCPSPRDLQMQQHLREGIAQWWIDHPNIVDIDANGGGDGRHLDDAVNGMLEGPVYAASILLQSGGYGGETAFLALANILKVDIVVWNAAAAVVAIPSVLQYGDEERVGRNWSFVQLWQRMTDETHSRWNIPLVHVQFNGINHYQAWIVTHDHAEDNNMATVVMNSSEQIHCDGAVETVKPRRRFHKNNDVVSLAEKRVKRQQINQHYRESKLTPESKRESQQRYRATKLTPESKRASQRLHMSKKSDAELADIRKKRCVRYARQKPKKKCEQGDEAISRRAESCVKRQRINQHYRATKLTQESKRA